MVTRILKSVLKKTNLYKEIYNEGHLAAKKKYSARLEAAHVKLAEIERASAHNDQEIEVLKELMRSVGIEVTRVLND
jgi:hypothetical protein